MMSESDMEPYVASWKDTKYPKEIHKNPSFLYKLKKDYLSIIEDSLKE